MIRRIPWRPIVAISVLAITVLVFWRYFATHPEVRQQITTVSGSTIALLLCLYVVFVACLAFINLGTLKICRSSIRMSESLLLSMYSSVINFFGPLQSGPAFRAVYLKHKHGVKYKDYTAASLVYYFFYALLSGVFLLSGVLGWWLVPLIGGGLVGLWLLRNTTFQSFAALRTLSKLATGNWYYLALATLAQVCLLAVIYYVELNTVSSNISVSQAIIYTGAANFALFVALTPGAIGFREAFLLFTERLHGIDASTIVAANTLDRAVYIVFLVAVAAVIGLTHTKQKLTN